MITATPSGLRASLVPLLRPTRDESGSVTAEFAMTVPALVVVVSLVVASLGVTSQSVRLADVAAVVARQAARGDGGSIAATLARLAPGATVSESSGSGLVCVDLRRDARLGPVGGVVTLTSRSCAPTAGR